MHNATGQLAVVTGASTGIGFELARKCAKHGYDLITRPMNLKSQLPPKT